MQIKIFNIPIPEGEKMLEEMNAFLRAKRILQTETQIIDNKQGSYWSFCIRYLEESAASRNGYSNDKKKVDYREILDDISFQRFARMREIRKQLATEEGIPAYAIFTDEELASLAKIELLTPAAMKTVKGIGEKKVEKYATHFINVAAVD